MNRQLRTSTFLITFIFILSGCAFAGKSPREVKELGPPLLRLTSAVQGVAERPGVYGFADGGSGEDCLRLGIEDDPSLRDPFNSFVVKVKCENKNALVLICDGNTVLFEDAGCTKEIDYPKGDESARACDFHIDPAVVCPR